MRVKCPMASGNNIVLAVGPAQSNDRDGFWVVAFEVKYLRSECHMDEHYRSDGYLIQQVTLQGKGNLRNHTKQQSNFVEEFIMNSH